MRNIGPYRTSRENRSTYSLGHANEIMLGIKQAEIHMKNDQLYKKVLQRPIRDQIRERQLEFTGHCLRMNKEEPANIAILCKSEIQ